MQFGLGSILGQLNLTQSSILDLHTRPKIGHRRCSCFDCTSEAMILEGYFKAVQPTPEPVEAAAQAGILEHR